ncbi:MAG: ChbG/HpnK family deacetylase [Acidobacteriaceae bacterium]|nr:ChbG/HpnK family deacetylase [Acidobacteriaceae bacterium]
MKRLIINADDFGFTSDVNAGIIEAYREGILTSTTLMANGSAFDDAVRSARETPSLDLGCHLVLVQGTSLLNGKALPKGPRQLLVTLARRDLDVYAELRLQIEKVLAAGITLTHLDTHKHTHLVPHVFHTVCRLAGEFNIPYVRLPLDRSVRFAKLSPGLESFYRRIAQKNGVLLTDNFLGFRLTGSLTEETLAAAILALPDGVTELMCHPGLLGPELSNAETRLKESRVRELEALTSARVRRVVAESGVRLSPFRKTAEEAPTQPSR